MLGVVFGDRRQATRRGLEEAINRMLGRGEIHPPDLAWFQLRPLLDQVGIALTDDELIAMPLVLELSSELLADGRAVVHLHGHWRVPRSVILGIRSYEELGMTATAQGLQHAMAAMKSLLFVGVGDGASDPNFSALREWLSTAFANSEYRHYRLCLHDEVERLSTEHGATERIFPLGYGDSHEDLAGFLDRLVAGSRSRPTAGTEDSQVEAAPVAPSIPDITPTLGDGVPASGHLSASPTPARPKADTASAQVTVTMLGSSGCGKTLFLLGMYAVLSAGLSGFFLNTEDADLDLDLSEEWDALTTNGVLPSPTPNEPQSYEFAFRYGLRRLLSVQFLDYPGGAMIDRSTTAGTAQLLQRLSVSDSVYLMPDGSLLAQGVDQRNLAAMRRHAKAERMTWLIQRAADRRGSMFPSIVVLLTKADLLDSHAADGAGAVESAIDTARAILPIGFEPGVTSLICPVSIGDIGSSSGGRVDPTRVSPPWGHKPMLFSLQQAYMQGRQSPKAQSMVREQAGIDSDETTHRQAALLGTELAAVPIFVDGQRVSVD